MVSFIPFLVNYCILTLIFLGIFLAELQKTFYICSGIINH